jgi:hypothetical protein
VKQRCENSGTIKNYSGGCDRIPGYDLSGFHHAVVTAGYYFTVRKRQRNRP